MKIADAAILVRKVQPYGRLLAGSDGQRRVGETKPFASGGVAAQPARGKVGASSLQMWRQGLSCGEGRVVHSGALSPVALCVQEVPRCLLLSRARASTQGVACLQQVGQGRREGV